jgi:murein DD-endopeptidase MepM/ murein hydrolase activator NlpD
MKRKNQTLNMLVIVIVLGTLVGLAVFIYRQIRSRASGHTPMVIDFIRNPDNHPEWIVKAGTRCGDAPFIFPTTGMSGFLWGDTFEPGHPHQGVDIFAGTDVGVTEVIAAYPGYLSREADWKSSVIIRIPDDPLEPGRQIWVYYTHLADAAGKSFVSSQFPPGTKEKFVEAGTFLGYQGNYSGNPGNPVGVHLHISIVRDDGNGRFKNELDKANTYDPSPYLGIRLNNDEIPDQIPVCEK